MGLYPLEQIFSYVALNFPLNHAVKTKYMQQALYKLIYKFVYFVNKLWGRYACRYDWFDMYLSSYLNVLSYTS